MFADNRLGMWFGDHWQCLDWCVAILCSASVHARGYCSVCGSFDQEEEWNVSSDGIILVVGMEQARVLLHDDGIGDAMLQHSPEVLRRIASDM